MTRRRNSVRAGVVARVLIVLVALAAGGIGGAWLASQRGQAAGSSAEEGATKKRMYTCGMHPQVLQDEPGDCPICHMKLTPVKDDQEPAQQASKERRILYWRAPMDPSYVSDRPGKSPMGMDLVPVYADDTSAGTTIKIDPVTIQNMGLRTTVISRGPLVKTIRTVGRVDYDEQTVSFLDTKFDGWIEKLHVDETGVQVARGQPLFDVYSPKLYAAQEEYLAALRGFERLADSTLEEAREQARRLLEAGEVQLRYFDVSQEQIDELRRTRVVRKTLTIHSPAAGIVTEKMALEGMYVKPGMRLFTIADLSRVWVLVDIYEYQLPWVRVGQRAVMSLPYVPGREFVGRVVYVYPYLDERLRVVKVRLEFENPTLELRPGMYANVRLEADLGRDALLIPREAYIDSGRRQLAFLALEGGKFEPREIKVGLEVESGMVELIYGLDEGDHVVASGQFLLDAESKLKEAAAKMNKLQPTPTTQPAAEAGEQAEAASAEGIPEWARYACPMEQHPDEEDPAKRGPFFSEHEGRCDLCGMQLKPLDELEWVAARRAAGGGEVAYTCPDHQHVLSEQSGQCPRCGHELEPFKLMYTCPDPEHADVIRTSAGFCPRDGKALVPFRSIWLSPEMAAANVPARPELAEQAPYRCAKHPLVHSDRPGRCTICAAELLPAEQAGAAEVQPATQPSIPAGAKYTCPMKECWYFSEQPGRCPLCGMKIKPLEDVEWAAELAAAQQQAEHIFVCPMHPDERQAAAGTCSICGMQLVPLSDLPRPTSAPAAVAVQVNFLTEHYLALQRRFAADRTNEVALHALGLVSAADALLEQIGEPGLELSDEFTQAVRRLRSAAVKINGRDLDADRVQFAALGSAMRVIVKHVRPDRRRWPRIYVFHCPMSKGDWLQTEAEMANPFYGFKMLKCGEPVEKY